MVWRKGAKSDPHLLQAHLFGVTNEEREKKVPLAANARLSYLGIYDQRTMTNDGAQRNVPHLVQAQQTLVYIKKTLQC